MDAGTTRQAATSGAQADFNELIGDQLDDYLERIREQERQLASTLRNVGRLHAKVGRLQRRVNELEAAPSLPELNRLHESTSFPTLP